MAQSLKRVLADYLSTFITPNRKALFERVLALRTRYLTVALDNVADPLDANAVMRSCECFGVQDLHVVPAGSGFKADKGVSVGSAKWITLYRYADKSAGGTRSCFRSLREKGYKISAVTDGGKHIAQMDLSKPTALVFGSEETGRGSLPEDVDEWVSIPTVGFSDTFNISVHVALCLQTLRNRLQHENHPWRLSAVEKLDLELEWLAKMPKRIGQITQRFIAETDYTREDIENSGLSREMLGLLLEKKSENSSGSTP
jgi:tRNA (guanosine-2'-O-)-methyltransferase